LRQFGDCPRDDHAAQAEHVQTPAIPAAMGREFVRQPRFRYLGRDGIGKGSPGFGIWDARGKAFQHAADDASVPAARNRNRSAVRFETGVWPSSPLMGSEWRRAAENKNRLAHAFTEVNEQEILALAMRRMMSKARMRSS